MQAAGPRQRPALRTTAMLCVALLLTGCATGRQPTAVRPDAGSGGIGDRVADIALSLRGSPYRYGASGPDAFDCSGLVHYAYGRAGVSVPRTARGQYDIVDRLYLHQLAPGDLVFFRTEGVLVSHVGIYVGDDRFVHAPKSESNVRISSLDLRYWRSRLIRAGSISP